MLQDLAAQRASGSNPTPVRPQTPPSQPVAPAVPPPAPAPVVVRPPVAPMPPPRPVTPPAPKEVPVAPMPVAPRPPAPVPPRPVTVAPFAPPKPAVSAPAQEGYSAELRTMSADIGNIKTGQAPAGIRQSTPSVPSPARPAVPAPAPAAPPVAPKAPPIIVVNPPKIVVPAPVIIQAPAPRPAPAAPQPPVAPIIVVPQSGGGLFRTMIYGVIVLIILGAIAYGVVVIIGGKSTPEATVSPSTSASPLTSSSPTPTLGAKELRSYFGNPGQVVNLQSTATGTQDLLNALVSIQPATKQAISIALQHQGSTATATTFFTDTMGGAPSALSASLGSDWTLLAYGQSEGFDANGARTSATSNGTRLVVLAELTDASKANQALSAWETAGLASASAGVFQFNLNQHIVSVFNSGIYREIPVRYWNFPYADRSIDYAIVTASNNKNYLILSGSREAAFFAIDQLMQ